MWQSENVSWAGESNTSNITGELPYKNRTRKSSNRSIISFCFYCIVILCFILSR